MDKNKPKRLKIKYVQFLKAFLVLMKEKRVFNFFLDI